MSAGLEVPTLPVTTSSYC